jgi:Zn-dependent protease with chaperone function
VVLAPEPEFSIAHGQVGIFSEGSTPRLLRGRILVLGHPLLVKLTVSELRAILAHEMAHWTGSDRFYTALVRPVYVSINAALERMGRLAEEVRKGETSWLALIPGYATNLVLRAYLAGFALIDAAVSRQRETRADVIAALHTGRDTTVSAMKKTARFSGAFYLACDRYMAGAAAAVTYYNLFFELCNRDLDLLQDVERSGLNRKGRIGDRHPPPAARLRALPRCFEANPDHSPARELLSDYEAKERQLVETYNQLLANF